MLILGIETSCDETAVSVLKAQNNNCEVFSNTISSQVKLHAKWGGVVPNLAAREHLKNIVPVLKTSLREAGVKPQDIDLISVTQGPGLIPALLIGTNAAKTLSYIWQKPLLGIHHIEGHIYANFIKSKVSDTKDQRSKIKDSIKFPILCLVVSGGHTQLVLMKDHLRYKIIGQTLDDAAGEAFDKVARILELSYPGGPAIANRASQIVNRKFNGKNDTRYAIQDMRLPRPMINSGDFNFSFSGLKTAVLYLVKKIPSFQISNLKSQICFDFQQAVIDVLVSKTLKSAEKYNPKTIMLAGGVSANQELRHQLGKAVAKEFPLTAYCLPPAAYSIDNASMIAAAGYFRWKKMTAARRKEALHNWKRLQTDANLKL